MEYVFERAARGGVGENAPGQFVATQPAVVSDDFFAEESLDFGQRGLARLDHLAGDNVGIDHGKAALAQQIGCGRFAHADAAGQSEGFHERQCGGTNVD